VLEELKSVAFKNKLFAGNLAVGFQPALELLGKILRAINLSGNLSEGY